MIRQIVTILLVAGMPLVAGQKERLGGCFAFTLPEGFVHKPGKGLDTSPGDIFGSKSGLEIHYDIGVYSGARDWITKWRAQGLKVKTIPLHPDLGTAVVIVIEAKERWVVFATDKSDICFSARIRTDQDLDDFTSIVSSIRLMERSDPSKIKAERAAGQPADRPESKPEGDQKPQPKSEGRSR